MRKKSGGKSQARDDANDTNEASSGESFEAALLRLQAIVGRLEEGELPLDESLALYEEGVQRLGECRKRLEEAELKIERLVGIEPGGETVTEAMPEEALSLEEKQSQRSRRRSASP